MISLILMSALSLGQADQKQVMEAEKKAFFELLRGLPTRGEFFSGEAIDKVIPYFRVLLALTERDVPKQNIFPFLALNAGLRDRPEMRKYAFKNFGAIAHPTLKLSWAITFVRDADPPPEIVAFLRKKLDSKDDAEELSDLLGPGYEEFRELVIRTSEASRRNRVEFIKTHPIASADEIPRDDFSTCQFLPGPKIGYLRAIDQRGELLTYDILQKKDEQICYSTAQRI